MPIIFRCQCRKKIQVSRRKAGKTVSCPKCGVGVVVPDVEVHATQELGEPTVFDPNRPLDEIQHVESLVPVQPSKLNTPNPGSQFNQVGQTNHSGELKLEPLDRSPGSVRASKKYRPPTTEKKSSAGAAILIVGLLIGALLSILVGGYMVFGLLSRGGQSVVVSPPNDPFDSGPVHAPLENDDPLINKSVPDPIARPANDPFGSSGLQSGEKSDRREPPVNGSAAKPVERPENRDVDELDAKTPAQETSKSSGGFSSLAESFKLFSPAERTNESGSTELRLPAAIGPIPGIKERLQLDCFPEQLAKLTHLDLLKVKPEEFSLQPGIAQRGSARFPIDWIIESSGVASDNVSAISIGTMDIVEGNFTNKPHSPPHLIVLKVIEPLVEWSPSMSEVEKEKSKLEIAGKIIYRLGRNAVVGQVGPSQIAIGTQNEVLYAMRFRGRVKNHPGFEWLDVSDFTLVEIEANQRADGLQLPQAQVTVGDEVHLYEVASSAKEAKFKVSETNSRFQLMSGEISPEQYAQQMIDAAGQYSLIPVSRKQRQDMLEVARKMQAEAAERRRDIPLEYDWSQTNNMVASSDGLILKVVTKPNERAPASHGKKTWLMAIDLDVVRTPLQESLGNDQGKLAESLESLKRFETYDFDSVRTRAGLEADVESGVHHVLRSSWMRDKGLQDYARTINFLLNNTSSDNVRRGIIHHLAQWFCAETVYMLGIEAEQFDLTATKHLLRSSADDIPPYIAEKDSDQSDRRPYLVDEEGDWEVLLGSCRYFLKTGGDPAMAIAACRILEDLGSKKYLSVLNKVAGDSSRVAAVRQAAKRAVSTITGQGSKPANVLPKVPDEATALTWLNDSNRPNKAAAIEWVIANELSLETVEEFIQALVMILDEATLHERAAVALKARMSKENAKYLRGVVERALNPDGGVRMRQDYSIFRVIDLAYHLKDGPTLVRASMIDKKSERTVKGVPGEHAMDMIAKLDLDTLPILNVHLELIERAYSPAKLLDNLTKLKLTPEGKARFRKWLAEFAYREKTVAGVEKMLPFCDAYRKDMVPVLIQLWSRGADTKEMVAYLKQYGTAIEPLVIEAVESRHQDLPNGRPFIQARDLCELLSGIGTEKCFSLFGPYLDYEDLHDSRRKLIVDCMDQIEAAQREQGSFESALDPNQ